MKHSERTITTRAGLKVEFHKLPEWRVEEVLGEMDEARKKVLVLELKRRLASKETVFYAEIPREGGPGETVGVGSWRLRSWPRMEGTKEDAGLAEVSFVHVRPSHRRKGVGEALMRNAIEDAMQHFGSKGSKLRKVYALVPSSDRLGREAYLRWGFTEEALLKGHFSKDEDMVVMSFFVQ
ncbi:MAG: GNAT family N-acetyltransferase [Candidatus Thermoplasmatota archaeon]|jgi:ribosomal protein S18 acetylase RimI-like enzyme|nr:GNAT family N-acetyltransferase [Candidatus Thermoplasmatota archaeon]